MHFALPKRWHLAPRKNKALMTDAAFGRVAIVVSVLCASTFGSFAKELREALSPLSLMFISEVLTLSFIIVSFGLIPTAREIVAAMRRKFLPLLLVGILSGVLGPLVLFTGIFFTTAINSSLFGRIDIVILIGLAHFLLGEKLTREHYAAMIFSLLGTVFIALRGFTDTVVLQQGDLLIILSSVLYALGSIGYRKYLLDIQPHVALMSRSIVSIVAFFVISPFLQETFVHQIEQMPLALLPTLLGFAFISRFLNAMMYYEAIERVPVIVTTIIGSTDIFVAALFANLYLGETIAWYHIVGGVLLLGSNLTLAVHHTPTTAHKETTTVRHRV